MRESEIEKYLVKRVEEAGGEVRKLKWIGRRGAPDRVVFHPRIGTLFVELKAPGKQLEPHQMREITTICAAGGKAAWMDSKEDVDVLIEDLTECKT